jgi:hypothetical protein
MILRLQLLLSQAFPTWHGPVAFGAEAFRLWPDTCGRMRYKTLLLCIGGPCTCTRQQVAKRHVFAAWNQFMDYDCDWSLTGVDDPNDYVLSVSASMV